MIEVTGLSELVVLVILDAGVWIALSVAVGYGAHHLPARWIEQDRWLTRLRRFEADGYFWRRHLAIGRWKDHLPEAGSLFGGVSKRRLPPGGDLHSLAVETRRAELVHWTLLACAALFPLWNPPGLAVAMGAVALVANLPCLVVQRYNRARLLRVVSRRRHRAFGS